MSAISKSQRRTTAVHYTMHLIHRLMNRPLPVLLSDAPMLAACKPGTLSLSVSDATLRKYEEVIRRAIDYYGDDRDVSSITRAEFAGFHDWLATRGTRAVTTNGYRKRIRAIWNRLRERGVTVCDIKGIVTEEVEPLRTSNAIHDRHLTKILQVAPLRDAAIVMLTVRAGIRRQTIPRLRVADSKLWQREDGSYRFASRIPREKTSPPRLIMAEHDAAVLVKYLRS